jgi:hypothetical protein
MQLPSIIYMIDIVYICKLSLSQIVSCSTFKKEQVFLKELLWFRRTTGSANLIYEEVQKCNWFHRPYVIVIIGKEYVLSRVFFRLYFYSHIYFYDVVCSLRSLYCVILLSKYYYYTKEKNK